MKSTFKTLSTKTLALIFALSTLSHISKANAPEPSEQDTPSFEFYELNIDTISDATAESTQTPQPEKTHAEKVEEAYKALKLMVASYLEFLAQQRYKTSSLKNLSEQQKVVIASIAMKNFFIESTCISGNFVINKIKCWTSTEQEQDGTEVFVAGIAQELVNAYFQTALSGLYKDKQYQDLTFKQKSFVWLYFFAQLVTDSLHMSTLGLTDGAQIASESCKNHKDSLLALGSFSAGWLAHWFWSRR